MNLTIFTADKKIAMAGRQHKAFSSASIWQAVIVSDNTVIYVEWFWKCFMIMLSLLTKIIVLIEAEINLNIILKT